MTAAKRTHVSGVDWLGVEARINLIVDALSDAFVGKDFKLDREAGLRAAEYCRSLARSTKPPSVDQPPEEAALIRFVTAHGQSLDWVLTGDLTSTICMLACANREGAEGPPTAGA